MIDLFCGLGGFTEGGLAEGYDVVGFDIERHAYGEHRYPAQLVLQDALTIHGRQFKDAALIVASPPCQEYSYMAMPWSRAKQIAKDYRSGVRDVKQLTALFDACFRIQREAIEAAGHHIPLVVENVRGAQAWVGRSRYHFGSFHLWGDVPALMPMTKRAQKFNPDRTAHGQGSWFAIADSKNRGSGHKVPGFRFDGSGKSFQSEAVKVASEQGRRTDIGNGARFTSRDCGVEAEHIKNTGGSWFNIGSPGQKETGRNPVHELTKNGGDWFGSGPDCSLQRRASSKSSARKQASAQIAKIPIVLSRHIAKSWRPDRVA